MYTSNIKDYKNDEFFIKNSLVTIVTKAIDYYEQTDGALASNVFLLDEYVFMSIAQNETEDKDSRMFEYHKNFWDIHITMEGCEAIGYTSNLADSYSQFIHSYNKDSDLGFIEKGQVQKEEYFDSKPGYICVLSENQLHKPLCKGDDSSFVKKIIIKIHKSYFG